MAATPSKTQVDAANRQLQGMHQQLVDQEAKFKVVLNEKEEEIVRLHQLMEQLEMKFTAKLEAATAQAEVAEAEAVGKSIAKDNEVQILRQTLEQIATLATAAGFDSMVSLPRSWVDGGADAVLAAEIEALDGHAIAVAESLHRLATDGSEIENTNVV